MANLWGKQCFNSNYYVITGTTDAEKTDSRSINCSPVNLFAPPDPHNSSLPAPTTYQYRLPDWIIICSGGALEYAVSMGAISGAAGAVNVWETHYNL